ncbi:MAG: hypothetical protein Q4A01_01535, partial [Coriobacteriales bacterium]|nr:hypothetical protein [Coriobacteriales bacterium]
RCERSRLPETCNAFWNSRLVPLLLVATIMRDRLSGRWYTVLLVLGLLAIVLVWAVRLVVSPDTCLFVPCALREDIVAVGEPQWVGIIRELLAH